MKEIGSIIKSARKIKGLSQEALAELAQVNIRTIQRIENNQTEPRGETLNLVCKALDLTTEDLYDFGKVEDHSYKIYLYLSILSFLIIPLGNILLPLILWLNKREKIVGLKQLGSKVLKFQIIWSLLFYMSFIGAAMLKILHLKGVSILWTTVGILIIGNIVYSISMAIKMKRSSI